MSTETKTNDQVIEAYREKVEAKRAALGNRPSVQYTTNALFPMDGRKLNLNTVGSIDHCIEVARDIAMQTNAQKQANEWLGTDKVLEIGGYSVEDWISDLKARMAALEWAQGKKELDAADKKLAELLSNEAKTANAISDIVGNLGI